MKNPVLGMVASKIKSQIIVTSVGFYLQVKINKHEKEDKMTNVN